MAPRRMTFYTRFIVGHAALMPKKLVICLLLLTHACSPAPGPPQAPMNPPQQALFERKARVIDGMKSYMHKAPNARYDQADINACDRILSAYLNDTASPTVAGDEAKLTALVKRAVIDLNKLNAACGTELIETDQREQIVPLLLDAASLAGLKSGKRDITEPWREW